MNALTLLAEPVLPIAYVAELELASDRQGIEEQGHLGGLRQ
jgi:hypothetical protein